MKFLKRYKKYALITLFGILSFIVITTGPLIQNRKNIASSQATSGCYCNDQDKCYPDGCTRKPIKNDGSIDYNRCGQSGCNGAYNACYDTNSSEAAKYFCLQQPPCCAEMARRNDPEACCWPEKGFCYPNYCKQMSRPESCGWYWEFHERDGNIGTNTAGGYGCMIGDSAQTMRPVFGLPAIAGNSNNPTNTPRPNPPTNTPIPQQPTLTFTPIPNQPTNSPTNTRAPIQPTFAIQLTQNPNSGATWTPVPTWTEAPTPNTLNPPNLVIPTSISLKSPKEFAREIINPENIQKLNDTTEKPLAIAESSVTAIKSSDQKLETFIEENILFQIKIFFLKLFQSP